MNDNGIHFKYKCQKNHKYIIKESVQKHIDEVNNFENMQSNLKGIYL